MATVGRADPDDACEVAGALLEVRALTALCRDHLAHENDHVHPAMESRRPGSAGDTARDHAHHLAACEALEHRAAEHGGASNAAADRC